MRTWAKGSASAAFLAAGVMALGSGTAYADTIGDGSIGGGNQINLPINLPIDISGNAVSVGGHAEAFSHGGASATVGSGGSSGNRTSGSKSILGGNQVNAPITAPINVCGNAISLFGEADARCKGGAQAGTSGQGASAGGNRTSGSKSILGGNQVVAPISAAVNACGTAIAILGRAEADCKGGASAGAGGRGVSAGGNRTSGSKSILGGNQVVAPITAPINVCGTSIAVLGNAFAGCKGGASAGAGGRGVSAGGNRTSGSKSILGGNQVVAPITAPINVCGTSIAVLGNAFSGCKGGAEVGKGKGRTIDHGYREGGGRLPSSDRKGWRKGKTATWKWHKGYVPASKGHDTDRRYAPGSGSQVIITTVKHKPGVSAGGNRTSGARSILGGNQVVAPITAPINVCGNAIGVLGDVFAGCRGGAVVKGGVSAGGNRTSGARSILGGNQVVAPITAPINVCGNAIGVLGDAKAGCRGGAAVAGGVSAGGNRTSGYGSILGGNQVVAPITAPINVCGNSVAVLGDAAAGCFGTARVGGRAQSVHHLAAVKREGALSEVPALPVLSDLKEASGLRKRMSASALPSAPVIGDLPNLKGLPSLPNVPVLSDSARKPESGAAATLEQATGNLPVGGVLRNVTDTAKSVLPLDGLLR